MKLTKAACNLQVNGRPYQSKEQFQLIPGPAVSLELAADDPSEHEPVQGKCLYRLHQPCRRQIASAPMKFRQLNLCIQHMLVVGHHDVSAFVLVHM